MCCPSPASLAGDKSDAMAASRIADSFELKLCLNQTRPSPLSLSPAGAGSERWTVPVSTFRA